MSSLSLSIGTQDLSYATLQSAYAFGVRIKGEIPWEDLECENFTLFYGGAQVCPLPISKLCLLPRTIRTVNITCASGGITLVNDMPSLTPTQLRDKLNQCLLPNCTLLRCDSLVSLQALQGWLPPLITDLSCNVKYLSVARGGSEIKTIKALYDDIHPEPIVIPGLYPDLEQFTFEIKPQVTFQWENITIPFAKAIYSEKAAVNQDESIGVSRYRLISSDVEMLRETLDSCIFTHGNPKSRTLRCKMTSDMFTLELRCTKSTKRVSVGKFSESMLLWVRSTASSSSWFQYAITDDKRAMKDYFCTSQFKVGQWLFE